MQKKNKQKRGLIRRTGDFVVAASGWPLIAMGGREIYRAWLRIAERDRPIIVDDSWEKACARHNVTPERLEEVKGELTVIKRTYMICAVACVYIAGLAMYLILQDFSWARLNMLVGGVGGASICFAYVFKHSFRLWQCEIRKLDGLGEFWRQGGAGRMVRW